LIGELAAMDPKLSKEAWRPFLDRVTRSLTGKRAEVEIASLNLGDQIAAERLPIIGISYDPNDDIVEVALEGYDHLINAPREIHPKRDDGQLSAIEIVDADFTRHIVKLSDPLALTG
jgi:hypothetical protein